MYMWAELSYLQNTGRRSRGTGEQAPPQNLEWGTLMQIVPPDFVTKVQKGACVAFKIRQNPFSAIPHPTRHHPPSALAMRRQNSRQIYACAVIQVQKGGTKCYE